MPAQTARPIVSCSCVDCLPEGPHVPLPLTLTLSPRREERRGERGRAHPLPWEDLGRNCTSLDRTRSQGHDACGRRGHDAERGPTLSELGRAAHRTCAVRREKKERMAGNPAIGGAMRVLGIGARVASACDRVRIGAGLAGGHPVRACGLGRERIADPGRAAVPGSALRPITPRPELLPLHARRCEWRRAWAGTLLFQMLAVP